MSDLPFPTLLLQGQFSPETSRIVRECRQAWPQLPIVVSCWEADRAQVPEDVVANVTLVCSPDPGSPRVDGFKVDNIRRQLVSTSAGLAACTTDWTIKVRSDLSVDLRRVRDAMRLCTPVPTGPARMFGHRVVVTSLTTLDARRSGLYFHVCDWFYLGRTDDLRALFAADLPEGDFFEHFSRASPRPEICSRHRSETYMVYQLARRLGLCADYPFSGHRDDTLAAVSERLLAANFAVVNPWNLGLRSHKHRKLYLWLHPDRLTERRCGARAAVLGRRTTLAEVPREALSRAATRLASTLVRWRSRFRDA